MTTVSRTFTVRAAPAAALAYLADFGHAEEWDPGTERCTRNDSGPVQLGSSWHNVSKIAGITTELTYTLEELTDEQIVLVGRNDTATSTETILVTGVGTGAEITYTNDVEFNGLAKVAAPAAKVVLERLAGETEQQLIDRLNALAEPDSLERP